jgi:nitrite reductase/ring-hydroxylating ferredoxin subunit
LKDTGHITRRTFVRLLTMAVAGLFLSLWFSVTRKNSFLTAKPDKIRVDIRKLGKGIYFREDLIIIIDGEGPRFFSNRCTHAGCTINREVAGEIVCSCHGSRYEASTGRVLQGPAVLPLRTLSHSKDTRTGEMIVKV